MKSVKQRIFLALLVGGLAPLVLIVVATHTLTRQAVLGMQHEKIDELGDEVARQVESVMKGATADLESLASSPVLIDPDSTRDDVISEFDRLTRHYDYLDGITLFDPNGTWVHSNAEHDLGKAELSPEFTSYALAGKRHASTPEIPSFYRPNGKYPITLQMRLYVPVGSSVPPVRVVSAKVSMDPIWDVLDNARIGKSGMFTLVDHRGVAISDKSKDKAGVRRRLLKEEAPSFWQTNPSGYYAPDDRSGEYYYQTKQISLPYADSSDWVLVCAQAKDEIEEVITETQFYQIIVAGITVLLAYGVGYVFSRKITQPILHAARAAELVASGDLETTVPEDGPTEIRALSVSFNKMTHELKDHRSHLESLVQSRTRRLRESQGDLEDLTAQLRAAYDSTQEAVIVTRPDGKVLTANRRMNQFFGIAQARLHKNGIAPGSSIRDELFSKFSERSKFEQAWEKYASNPDLVGEEEWELTGQEERQIALYSAPVKSSSGLTFARLWMFRDMTEQRKLERSLQQSQKMEAIGRLSGGVAHDFNNLLTGIIGSLSLAELEGHVTEEATKVQLNSAKSAAERAAGIVRQLLTFSRQSKISLQQCEANKLFRDVNAILTYTIDPNVIISLELDENNPSVIADASQIDQVLMNLCVNARDAMPEGGSLVMRTGVVHVNRSAIPSSSTAEPGDFVRLSVEDSGNGIPEDIREKIFEPFFTTKEQGKGTGLGLATSYGIAQQHGGWLRCDSEEGKGTKFELFLPLSNQASKKAPAKASAAAGGSETILVVDDETIVRVVAEGVLKRHGYRVLSAHDGKEALEVVARSQDDIDLIMLDLTMPRLSGKDTFAELRNGKYPHIPVVICSGYLVELDEFEASTGSIPEGSVQKPYEVNTLAAEVRRILDLKSEGLKP